MSTLLYGIIFLHIMKVGVEMKNFKRIIAMVLAVVLVAMTFPVVAFAATKGDVNGDGSITATDARLILQIVANVVKESDVKDADAADYDGNGSVTAVDARRVLQVVAGIEQPENPTPEEPDPDKPIFDMNKAELVALFNAESAKIANGTYKWSRSADYDEALKVDPSSLVSAIQPIADDFLGIGDDSGDQTDAGKYAVIAMKLTEDDVKDIQVSNDQITLILNDTTKPEAGGNSPFSHVSNDIVTKSDVEKIINDNLEGAKITEFHTYYYDVKVTAQIGNGVATSLKISYKLYAKLGAKYTVVNASGEGTVETEIEYTDLKY